jgi:hypothetical protein
MRQRPIMLKHGPEITAIDPPVAGRAPDEMLGLVIWRIADTLAKIFAARENHGIGLRPLSQAPAP